MRSLFVLSLALLSGCPASTTLSLDAGGDASMHAWDACTQTSECVLATAGCCLPCGTPMLASYDAVNRTQTDAHQMDVCPAPMPCPRCATGSNANLVATCASSHCAAVDLSMLPLSACTTDADCVVRYANCCGCSGTATDVVSIRADGEGAIEALLCDGGGCALDCAPQRDPGFDAVCDASTHHCAAVPH